MPQCTYNMELPVEGKKDNATYVARAEPELHKSAIFHEAKPSVILGCIYRGRRPRYIQLIIFFPETGNDIMHRHYVCILCMHIMYAYLCKIIRSYILGFALQSV